MIRLIRLSVSVTLAALLATVMELPLPAAGQPQPSPRRTPALSEAKRLSEQAEQLYQQGKYYEAIPLAKRSLIIFEQVLGPNNPDVATVLDRLAWLHYWQRNYVEAESLWQRALAIHERLLNPDNLLVGISLRNLASLYETTNNKSKAESLYRRALPIFEKAFAPDSPEVINIRDRLVGIYEAQGDYQKAEFLLKQSLGKLEKRWGSDHPEIIRLIDKLARFYKERRNYTNAEFFFKRSLSIREQAFGFDSAEIARTLDDLAEIAVEQKNYTLAESLIGRALGIREKAFRRALDTREKIYSLQHREVVYSLQSLASLYFIKGNYRQTESYFEQALAICEQFLDAPLANNSIYVLVGLYSERGEYQKAELVLKKGLAIYEKLEKAVGKKIFGNDRYKAELLSAISVFYQRQGNSELATQFAQASSEIDEYQLSFMLRGGSEEDMRRELASFATKTDRLVSLHLQSASANPKTAQLALTTILRRKGRILDVLTDKFNRSNQTPERQQVLDRLNTTRAQLAALYYGNGSIPLDQYRRQIQKLEQQASHLELLLNASCLHGNASCFQQYRNTTQPITIEAIQALIPTNTTLVEFIRYTPFNPKASQKDNFWGTPRYAAYLLTSQGKIDWVNLGEAELIDQQVENFRYALRNSSSDIKSIARKLDASLMQPIRQKLGNSIKLLLSPDSQLNLIPFAALVDEQNRYLVETYEITYLTSGRDLLRLQNHPPSRQPPVLIANPDYDKPGDPSSGQIVRRSPSVVAQSSSIGTGKQLTQQGINQRSSDLAQLRFGSLPGTAAEATAIAPKLPGAILLMGSQATESALKQVQAPRILHIATHGFFLEDMSLMPSTNLSRGSGLPQLRSDIVPMLKPGTYPAQTKLGNPENALLRSGLALAGFNPRQSGSDDGVLTALEAAGLDLRGTQLVVLSACETGVGDVVNGEGVYGLRRALVMAGAESQLIGLWKVDDTGTKDLMVKYYDRLLAREGRSAALRQVQLEFLNQSTYQHPYYWAAFIPSGNWQPLSR